MEHRLKCWPKFFTDVRTGVKNFELRKDDRSYEDWDTLILEEFDPVTKKLTGHQLHRRIVKVYRGLEPFGLRKGYCILQLCAY